MLPLIVEYEPAFPHSVIAELEFLNERSEFRNSSSAIQVTMKTKTLELTPTSTIKTARRSLFFPSPPFQKKCFYKLSPKSSLNLAASLSCQSLVGVNLPKKNLNVFGSSENLNPPINFLFL
ncbi:MAG: hypothetical protein LBG48_05005 [Rickettsiales bacterium]|nr:hypothetical protein [Rickettsiales bacterium]